MIQFIGHSFSLVTPKGFHDDSNKSLDLGDFQSKDKREGRGWTVKLFASADETLYVTTCLQMRQKLTSKSNGGVSAGPKEDASAGTGPAGQIQSMASSSK